jgi:hypothetical protein
MGQVGDPVGNLQRIGNPPGPGPNALSRDSAARDLRVASKASLLGTMSIMQVPDPIYLELVDFVAAGSTPQDVANFHPSPALQARAAELVERERDSRLTPEESAELAHFVELEHILRMAKARARLILAGKA